MRGLDSITEVIRSRWLGRKKQEAKEPSLNRESIRAAGLQGRANVISVFEDGQMFGKRKGKFLGPMARPSILVSNEPGWRDRAILKVLYGGLSSKEKRMIRRERAREGGIQLD